MTPALVAGRPASLDDAVASAAALLARARFPLVFGLVSSTVEAQREATRVAERLGAALDSAATAARGSGLGAFAALGLVSTSLGALRRHADLVVFWGSDPDREHPGFLERYAPEREGRVRVSVDVGDARGPARSDARLALATAQELGALLVLRAFVRGRRVEPEIAAARELPLDALRGLAGRLTSCSYAVLVHDGDPPAERREPERAWALGALARDANRKACVRLFTIRAPGNAVGAENVLAWRTGFPAAVSFAGGEPRHGLGELDGETLLRRGDVDAALLVGGDPARALSPQAQAHLGRIPTVRLGTPGEQDAARAVFIATAPFAASAGSVFRMDGVVQRQAARPAAEAGRLPTEAVVLARIAELLAPGGTPR